MKKLYCYYNYLLSSMLWMLGFGMFGCTKQVDEYGPEPVMYGPAPEPVFVALVADSNYVASLSELQKVWDGEYEGWDDNQQKVTKIRRQLTLMSNETYTNIIQGVMIESGKLKHIEFEHEEGIYYYNTRTKTITYTVSTDSVLDYSNQKMVGYKGKKYYDHTGGNYTEKVLFSVEHDGICSWITTDAYLYSLINKNQNVIYHMDIHQGELYEHK